jgi:hypothetical protein
MLIKKGTFVFNCTPKGGIPMIVEKCRKCKLSTECTIHNSMEQMERELEHEMRYETSEYIFRKSIIGG